MGGDASVDSSAAVGWALAIMTMAQFVVMWGYFVLFEALADGRTIGKRVMRLRVVREGDSP